MTLISKFMSGAGALALVAAFAAPAAALEVDDIEVDIKAAAVQGGDAQPYFTKLSQDLKQMIAASVEAGDGEEAVDIMVSIDKISLDGSPIGPDAAQFNEMDGVVSIHPAAGGQAVISYPVRLAAYADDRAMPEGFLRIAPTDDDFYQSMLSAFAQETAGGLSSVPVSAIKGEGAEDR